MKPFAVANPPFVAGTAGYHPQRNGKPLIRVQNVSVTAMIARNISDD
jgi:hypothetical protein